MTKTDRKPQIRFKGFNDAWEQCKVEEVANVIDPHPSHRAPEEKEIGIPFIGIGDVDEVGNINYTAVRIVDKKIYDEHRRRYDLNVSSIGIGRVASLGKVIRLRGDIGKFAVSPTLAIIQFYAEVNDEYIYSYMNTPTFQRQFAQQSNGSTRQSVGIQNLRELTLRVPCDTGEQKAIGSFFHELDNLITLHQRKYDKFTQLKKALLEKMFPQEGETIPQIRFKGFNDAWEQCKLGDVFISLQNNTLSRADLSSEQGVALNVHYGDVLIKFGEYLDIRKEALPMIMDSSVVAKYKASFLKNGDIIVADTAEDETVGKCSEIAGLTDEIVISGLHTMPYRPLFKFASGYLGYYMNSNSYHNQLLPLMQGIKVTSISKSSMQNTAVCYPKSEYEQAKISGFFRNIDNLITLHQRKIEKLKNIKLALLEKMFI